MTNSLIIREEQTLIEQNLEGFIDYQTLYLNSDFDISDAFLSDVVKDIINFVEYKNIFIPLCFGPIMSDFNGLRLATHIRCMPGVNQTKNIYIFSFVDINLLLNHECFDILKTKGVNLINYNFHEIQALVSNSITELVIEELKIEIQKLNLKIPTNYEDNHSIANEWAILRWSEAINANDDCIDKIKNIQESNLYFKYLKTLYPLNNLDRLTSSQLKIYYQDKPKILYIDDEAEKGWYEIFYKIIEDENKIYFRYLDEEFNEKSKEEIINISVKKVVDEDFDLVILDFRLHKDDFENINITEVTGYQILKKIKEHNNGIQVIIFSATNKVWNLQALQDAGSDGFIIKESPSNSTDSKFTKQSINNLTKSIELCLNMTFLKVAFKIIQEIKIHLFKISNDCNEKEFEKLFKLKFKNEIFIQLDIIYDCLKKSSIDISTEFKDENSYLNLSFISIFKIIELINDYYTDEKGNKLKSNSIVIQSYDQNSNSFSKCLNQYPTTRDKIITIIQFELKDNPAKHVAKINQFIKFRNNIIHPKTLKDYKKTSKEENLDFLNLLKSILKNVK